MLHRNEGPLDRAIRLAIGIAFVPIGLFVFGGVGGEIGGLALAGVGVLALVTGATGFCLLYGLLGISTLPQARAAPTH